MSKESLEQFMEKVGSNEELRASVENQLDSDGNISVGALITLGAENGCEFTFEDLTQNEAVELSDDELDGVAGGMNYTGDTGFRDAGAGSRVKLSVSSLTMAGDKPSIDETANMSFTNYRVGSE